MPEPKYDDLNKFLVSAGILLLTACGTFLFFYLNFGTIAFDPSKALLLNQNLGASLIEYYGNFKMIIGWMPSLCKGLFISGLLLVLIGLYLWTKKQPKIDEDEENKRAITKMKRRKMEDDLSREKEKSRELKVEESPVDLRSTKPTKLKNTTEIAYWPEFESKITQFLGREFEILREEKDSHFDLVLRPKVVSSLQSKDILIELKVLRKGGGIGWFYSVVTQVSLMWKIYTAETKRSSFPLLIIIGSEKVLRKMKIGDMVDRCRENELIINNFPRVREVTKEELKALNYIKLKQLISSSNVNLDDSLFEENGAS